MKKVILIFLFIQILPWTLFADIKLEKKAILANGKGKLISIPRIAINTQTNDALIVWNNAFQFTIPDQVSGRVVNGKGKTVGQTFSLATGKTITPALAYNPTTNRYLMAFTDDKRLVVQKLNLNGRAEGPVVDITSNDPRTANCGNDEARIFFNPNDGGYTLTWVSKCTIVSRVCATASLDGNGKSTRTFDIGSCDASGLYLDDPPKSDDPFIFNPDLLYLGASQKLFVLTRKVSEDKSFAKYKVGIINPEPGTKTRFKTLNKGKVLNPAPAIWTGSIAELNEDTAITFFTDNSSVQGRRIATSGKFLGPPFIGFQPPLDSQRLFWPSAAFTKTSKGVRGLLIAIEDPEVDGSSTVWAQELNQEGIPVGSPVALLTTSNIEMIVSGRMTALHSTASNVVPLFIWYGTLRRTDDFRDEDWGDEILKVTISLDP